MNWQAVYTSMAAQAAGYLAKLLDKGIPPENYESEGVGLYGSEWTWADEVRDALKCLDRELAKLDELKEEIPV